MWLGVVWACSGAPSAVPAQPPTRPAPVELAKPSPAQPAFDPLLPALRLPTHFVPIAYAATLSLDPAKPTFGGSMAITGELDRRSAVIWLHGRDLAIAEAHAEQGATRVALAVTPRGEDLLEVRPAAPLAKGRWVISLSYTAKVATDVRGLFRNDRGNDGYLFSYFEPVGARRVFPCLDEPGLKAPWTLTLDVPSNLVAVANTPVVSTTALDAGHARVAFATTKPVSTYLVAFGVGPFEVVDVGRAKSGLPLRIITPRGTAGMTGYARGVFPRAVDFLEDWFAIPFPYPKLDLLVVPSLGGGAMEHVGLVTLDASYVVLDPDKMSWVQRRQCALTIGHEIAHQWFGDLVTPSWWDDTWLKESFATWVEPKVLLALEPSWHDELQGTTRRNGALDADVLATARRIRQPITRTDEIGEVYDAITYTKGGALLNLFERYLGPEVFQRGVRDYLRAHADGTAVAGDLIAAFEHASAKPLAKAFATFLDQPGAPVFDVDVQCDGGARLRLSQRRYLKVGSGSAAPTEPWHVPVCIAYDRDGTRGELCTMVEAAAAEIALPGKACPRWVMPNAGGLGYYYTALTASAATALRDTGWAALSWAERRVVVEDVRGQVMQGRLPVALLMSFVPKLLAGTDRYALGDALGDRWSGDFAGAPSGLPLDIATDLAPTLQLRVDTWRRNTYGALARKRGFLAKPGETLDDEAIRNALVRMVAWSGDRTLVASAVTLAKRYRELPQSTRELVLGVAANADPAIAARLRADVVVEQDHDLRTLQLRALGSIQDEKRVTESLALALDPRIRNEDVVWFLAGTQLGAPKRASIRWLELHGAELLARFGKSDTFAPYLVHGVWTCDPAERSRAVALLTKLFGSMGGAAKLTRQKIEAIDQCIAESELVSPSLRAWLTATR